MGKHVLLVEDAPIVLRLLEQALGKEGYSVIPATDGVEAVKEARQSRPDLVILDLNIPKISGFEVCRILKSEPGLKQVPIVVLTSMDQESNRTKLLALGIQAYITKPFNLQELLKTVGRLTNGKSP